MENLKEAIKAGWTLPGPYWAVSGGRSRSLGRANNMNDLMDAIKEVQENTDLSGCSIVDHLQDPGICTTCGWRSVSGSGSLCVGCAEVYLREIRGEKNEE